HKVLSTSYPRDGRGACTALQMAQDLPDHLPMGDGGAEAQCPRLTRRTGCQVAGKDPLAPSGPAASAALRYGLPLPRLPADARWERWGRATCCGVPDTP